MQRPPTGPPTEDPGCEAGEPTPSRRSASLKGRGAASNPHNRFERIELEPDPEYQELEAREEADAEGGGGGRSAPRTQLFADPTRTILARNDSPDVPFDASVNPYRGCEHGCIYCLGPDTPVLYADMIWRPLGDTRVGDVLVGFDEQVEPGRTRKLRPATVEAIWWSRRRTLRLVTRHSEVVTTAEHRWLQSRDFRWSRTEQLSRGRSLRYMQATRTEPVDEDYRAGYVAGLSLGDGTFRYQPGWRSDKLGFPPAYWRVALIDLEPLSRLVEFLGHFGLALEIRPFSAGKQTRTPMWKVETRSLGKLEIVNKLISVERSSPSYRRGFLAGFFDAEGHNGTSLRISQVDLGVLARVQGYARSLGFDFQLEPRPGMASNLRLVGSIAERIRFFSACQPVIQRKLARVFGRTPPLSPEPVEAIERGPISDVVDIQTSTGTFYAAGLATHNCFARPTHEYLGFSAGLDFETKILVKREAPALLRAEIASARWRPQVVALSGVTDCYQPAERRLRITRGCLEVLAEFRNPVAVVTKSELVTRDIDLLAELARDGAAAVYLSITTLDASLQRILEPRAAAPQRRLRAVEALARAGVPVGVMIAPVLPGLTEHEIPRLVEAAAAAGAGSVGHLVLRLPHGLKQLFEDWLSRHFPERREKVLNRIRDLRGGALNDPRFHARQRGSGFFAREIEALVELSRRRAGLAARLPELSTLAFRRPAAPAAPATGQLPLFEPR
jgi:DNA repair photolyase